jgi:hypothetical protein
MEKLLGKQTADSLEMPAPLTYAANANILIGFPGFLTWFRSYQLMEDHASDNSLARKVDRYRLVKKAYENWVLRLLDRMGKRWTGKALISEIARAQHSISIVPQREAENDDKRDNAGADADSNEGATAKGEPVRLSDGSIRQPRQTGTGRGSDIKVEFTPSHWSRLVGSSGRHGPGMNAEDVLFHEMVHAARAVTGTQTRVAVNERFGDEEEFLAVMIANIYLSEKGETQLRANHSFKKTALQDPQRFLDNPRIMPQPRVLLESFRVRHRVFFFMLAAIPAHAAVFNPIRQYDEEIKQRDRAQRKRR